MTEQELSDVLGGYNRSKIIYRVSSMCCMFLLGLILLEPIAFIHHLPVLSLPFDLHRLFLIRLEIFGYVGFLWRWWCFRHGKLLNMCVCVVWAESGGLIILQLFQIQVLYEIG